jgi:carbamoyltransferase
VLAERAGDWFDIDVESPFMMLVAGGVVAPAFQRRRRALGRPARVVNEVRSDIPAVTHVDYSARLQTVNGDQSPEVYAILSAFEALTAAP